MSKTLEKQKKHLKNFILENKLLTDSKGTCSLKNIFEYSNVASTRCHTSFSIPPEMWNCHWIYQRIG